LGAILRLLRDYKPFVFFGSIALVMFLLGVIFGFSVVVEWVETGTVRRIPTAILSALFVLIGVQFFSLGLVADMIKGIRRRR